MEKNPSCPESTGCFRPFLVAACLFPLHICVSSIYGQSAGMLPQLLDKHSSIPVDKEHASWIASMPTMGVCLASCLTGTLADMFGRIRLVQAAYFFMGLGFAIMVAAQGFWFLVVGRFLLGIGIGCNFPASVYVSETAPPAYRGLFLTLNQLMFALGLVYIYIMGGYLPWIHAAGATSLMAASGLVLSLFLYDSPVWLVRQDRLEAAQKSLRQIESNPANIQGKLKELQETVEGQAGTSFSLALFAEPGVWKPFAMVLAMSVLQNVAGCYIVVYYSVEFLSEFHATFDPLQVSIGIAVVRMIGISVTSVWMQHAGRKAIGAISGFATAGSLLAIYAYLHFSQQVSLLAENQWILVVLFLMYMITSTLGVFHLPWTMSYELFPMKVRGLMCGICFCAFHLVMFVAVKLYYVLMETLGLGGMILLFAAGATVFGVFSATMLVETHRRTLEEVQQELAGLNPTPAPVPALRTQTPPPTINT